MDAADGKRLVVDPEVQAYVSSLVAALGGAGADEDGRYVLGDDALACLRDIKKWLKLYDEKANRLDVARCLAESNLVGGDLLQILAAWPEDATDDKIKSKIALACLELLVPLTWPIEKNPKEMTNNHHRHVPYLQLAQLGYKRSIINFDGAKILHTAIRCALPSMAEAPVDRTPRDEGIIKLLLYFIRNMAMLEPSQNSKNEGDESEISRSATIDAFEYQDIFHLLLTVSSTVGEDFSTQDVVILDILFHLIKGISPEKLFQSEAENTKGNVNELVRLRQKEAAMLRSQQQNAPSRHNRFGTMVWFQREDAKMSTVSNPAAMTNSTAVLAKMDSTKKFKPPVRAFKGETGPMAFDTQVSLHTRATKGLRVFVEEFLDSGFNPLFSHIRKTIDREAERVLEFHYRQFFYLVSWFLEAERCRRKSQKSASENKSTDEIDSYALVASVLNQEMFVTLNRAMDTAFENKSWEDLSAAMKCFTQILLTVQEMSESPLEDDQEIAENILSRIFYEETTHDRVSNITRTYKDQGFGYLNSCTELTHNYLRILEQYSKQNVDMQVRSKRRARRKKKEAVEAGQEDADMGDSDSEDETHAEKASNERKFDFKRFATRFVNQGCIDTFLTFTKFYQDLDPLQLKRAHRFFHRVAFKQDMSVMLFRVDIIYLFHKMIKGPQGLDSSASYFREWDDFVRQLIKRCTRKIQERPELVVEMLFSKVQSTTHYLEFGHEKQVIVGKPRAAAELEVKGSPEWEEQIGIVVGAMLDRNDGDHLQWFKAQLKSAETERRAWEDSNKALQENSLSEDEVLQSTEPPLPPPITIKADNSARKNIMFKNGHLRLLMTLAGLRREGGEQDPDSPWILPSILSADRIKEALDLIGKSEFNPPVFEDGLGAEDMIRRKSTAATARKRQAFDDEDDGIDNDDEESLFPANGPMPMHRSDALKELKKTRRLRRREAEDDEDEDDGVARERANARANARREKEREKLRKIKSELLVRDSDDESDEERDRLFFEREEKQRQRSKVDIMKELLGVKTPAKSNATKRPAPAATDSDDDLFAEPTGARKRARSVMDGNTDDENEDDVHASRGSSSTPRGQNLEPSDSDMTDTPMSSPHPKSSQPKRRKLSNDGAGVASCSSNTETARKGTEDDDAEDDDIVPSARPARQRVRSGFIIDSSDEE